MKTELGPYKKPVEYIETKNLKYSENGSDVLERNIRIKVEHALSEIRSNDTIKNKDTTMKNESNIIEIPGLYENNKERNESSEVLKRGIIKFEQNECFEDDNTNMSEDIKYIQQIKSNEPNTGIQIHSAVPDKSLNTENISLAPMQSYAKNKLHTCKECHKSFHTRSNLHQHMRIHTGEKPYICDTCDKKFNRKLHLKEHKNSHTKETQYVCNICNQRFSRKGDMLRHIRIHTGEKPYGCEACKATFSRKARLQIHMRIHTGENPFTCSMCGKSFNIRSHLEAHMRVHTGEKPYICNECNRTFSSKSNILRHIRTHSEDMPKKELLHYDDTIMKLRDTPFSCIECDIKFVFKRELNQHNLRTHIGEVPHKCDDCGITFSFKSKLIQHLLTHTGEKPYACKECLKTFNSNSNFHRHMMIHTKERPFPCNICDSKFTNKYHLKQHEVKHTGQKLYSCNLCNKKIARKGDISRHMRIHTGEKPYVCNQCEKSFNSKYNLLRHMRIHTGEKPFDCSQCTKTFSDVSGFQNEMDEESSQDIKAMVCWECSALFRKLHNFKMQVLHAQECLQNIILEVRAEGPPVGCMGGGNHLFSCYLHPLQQQYDLDPPRQKYEKTQAHPVTPVTRDGALTDYSNANAPLLGGRRKSHPSASEFTGTHTLPPEVHHCMAEDNQVRAVLLWTNLAPTDMQPLTHLSYSKMDLTSVYEVRINSPDRILNVDTNIEDDETLLSNDTIKSETEDMDDFLYESQLSSSVQAFEIECTEMKEKGDSLDGVHRRTTRSKAKRKKSFGSEKVDEKIKKAKLGAGTLNDVDKEDKIMIDEQAVIAMKQNYTIQFMGDEELQAKRERDRQSERYKNKPKYKCDSCIFGFMVKDKYEKHMQSRHSEEAGKHICVICRTRFIREKTLRQHVDSHHRKYLCKCGFVGYDLLEMAQHDVTEHGVSRFTCTDCGKQFPTYGKLKYHRMNGHAAIKCKTCGKVFKAKSYLATHIEIMHGSNAMKQCGVCGVKRRHLAAHMRTHKAKPEAAYCAECDIRFSSMQCYKCHIKYAAAHSPAESLKRSCSYCDFKTVNLNTLQKHITVKHLKKERPFKCHICDKGFYAECRLKSHVSVKHEGVKKPRDKICHVCGRGFTTKATLSNHIRVHTGEKPFRCEICDAAFSQSSSLATHTRGVHLKQKSRRNLNST